MLASLHPYLECILPKKKKKEKKLRKGFKHLEGELISVQEIKNNKHCLDMFQYYTGHQDESAGNKCIRFLAVQQKIQSKYLQI